MRSLYMGCSIPTDLTFNNRRMDRKEICRLCRLRDRSFMPLPCTSCICHGCNSQVYFKFIKELEEQAKEKGKMNKVPELKPGYVFRDDTGRWIMVVTKEEGYRLRSDVPCMIQAQCVLANYTPVEVYHPHHDYSGDCGSIFKAEELERVVNGYCTPDWKASKNPVEMTVDEVSEKLGYTVKIVGEKNA